MRGVILCVLATLGIWPEIGRAGDLVRLTGWAGDGCVVRGNGVGDDVFQLVAEAEWDRSAPRESARYRVRVAYPDGRVDTRAFPVDSTPGRRRFAAYVAASPLRGQFPSAVKVALTVVDAGSGTPVSNTLMAGIDQFPRPRGDASATDVGPFGRARPPGGAERILPGPGPDGLQFARIAATDDAPGFYLATTESTVDQVGRRLKGYDPKAGRSDEFALEDPAQPAINLTPSRAMAYLKSLGEADPSGVAYRLPTVQEWLRAARAGRSTAYWWGDEPGSPEGANVLGPEPALQVDASAPARPTGTSPTFRANPFGLAHTFGNAAEWATDPAGGYARMGGHFRSEPASIGDVEKVEKDDELGPDPFVGVRVAFDLTAESGAALVRKRLAGDPRLKGVAVAYDPEKASARLSGSVADASTVRAADAVLEGLWFVAAVENDLKPASLGANQLAILGPQAGPGRRLGVLDRTFVEVPLAVRWLDPLPVLGSEWWVNVYLPGGGHLAHKLDAGEVGRSSKTLVLIDRARLVALGLPDDSPAQVALSLGGPAATVDENRVASNVAGVRPSFAAKSR